MRNLWSLLVNCNNFPHLVYGGICGHHPVKWRMIITNSNCECVKEGRGGRDEVSRAREEGGREEGGREEGGREGKGREVREGERGEKSILTYGMGPWT